jgi:hypothetical protein
MDKILERFLVVCFIAALIYFFTAFICNEINFQKWYTGTRAAAVVFFCLFAAGFLTHPSK